MKVAVFACLLVLGCGSAADRGVALPPDADAQDVRPDARPDLSVPPELESRLMTAMETWQQAKPICRSYEYISSQTFMFARSSRATTVRIVDDRPVARSYAAYAGLPDGGIETTEEWRESGAEVGSHPNGDPPHTVEQLFQDCRALLARDPKANFFYLEIGERGVLKECRYRPMGCVDDCTVGFYIGQFDCLP
jgi:hypothetical protein